MILSSWNVNSVRARIDNILGYLDSSRPDILMMQEIKTEEKNFPYNEFKNVGYNSFVSGQKSYNGVAFLSKKNIENINLKFFNDKLNQARIIVGDLKLKTKKIKLINIYVPNGNPIDTEKYSRTKAEFINKLNVEYGRPTQKEGQSEAEFKADYATWKASTNYKRLRAEESKWDTENSEPIDAWEKELAILEKQIKNAKVAREKLKEEGKTKIKLVAVDNAAYSG